MRFFLTILLIVGCMGLIRAQVIVTEHYDKNGRLTDEQQSYYYRIGEMAVIVREFGSYTISDTSFVDTVKTFYTASNKIRSREFYLDGYREGPFSEYHENGTLKNKGTYHEDRKVGYFTSWYETGTPRKVLKYYPVVKTPGVNPKDSFQIVSYWSQENSQLIKDGNGYCACFIDSDEFLEKGKVVNGLRDSIWQYFSGDTLKFSEDYNAGVFLGGKTIWEGGEIPYTQREIPAEYRGGITAMYKFLQRTVKYPVYAKRMGIQGRVFAQFIVGTDGTLTDIKIIKGVSETLDHEAMRVIKAMPPWKPGVLRGLPVKCQFVLPISFKLGR